MLQLIASGLISSNNLPHAQATNNTLTTVMNTVLGVLGAVAFLMVVIAGLRYITSDGEPEKISEARRMIIYSMVGLVVISSAAAIVNFAIKSS